MSESGNGTLTPEAERVLEALNEFGAPEADAALRERLKQEFVSGRILECRLGHQRDRHGLLRFPRRPAGRFLRPAFLAVAAIIAILPVGIRLNAGPPWRLTRAVGTGTVEVDGTPIPIGRLDLLRESLRPGAEILVPPQGDLEIVSPRRLAIRLTPGTSLTVPSPPSRWIGRSTELHARAGTLQITTGEAFPGSRLTVRTPDAAVEITGTTLGVILEPTGTCVCVLQGTVRARGRAEDMMTIPAGRRCYFFNDNRPPQMEDILPMERAALAQLREAHSSEN